MSDMNTSAADAAITDPADILQPTVRRAGSAPARAAESTSRFGVIAAGLQWVLLLAFGAASMVPVARQAAVAFNEITLVHAEENVVRERLVEGLRNPGTANELEALSELSLLVAGEETALTTARAAAAADGSRPFVWARVAWLEADRTGSLNPDALAALERSMDLCPLCSEELVRWRFNFVLTYWRDAPDALRRRAFEHADILRWRGQNAEFLAEMRIKAARAGIPFDAYRAAVDTPVRSWDLGPKTDNASTRATART